MQRAAFGVLPYLSIWMQTVLGTSPVAPQPSSPARTTAYVTPPANPANATVPAQSTRIPRGPLDSGPTRSVSHTAATLTARFTKKIRRHPGPSVSTPPSTGPTAAAPDTPSPATATSSRASPRPPHPARPGRPRARRTVREPARRRRHREHHHAHHVHPPAPQIVGGGPDPQQQRGRHRRVPVDHPLHITRRRVQRPRHVRQRDHHDRHVEQQHERAQTHRRQRPPCTSRASFSRLGTVLGASDQTVGRRYRRLTAEAGLRVVAIRDAERPDTAWIGLASGGTEIICLTRPRNPGDHDDLLLGRLPRATGRPESAVERRLAALIGSGAVYIDIEYDSEVFGYARAAVLWITAAPAGLYAYLSGPLGQLDGVRHVEASAFLRRVKQLTYRTLPLNSPSTRAPSK